MYSTRWNRSNRPEVTAHQSRVPREPADPWMLYQRPSGIVAPPSDTASRLSLWDGVDPLTVQLPTNADINSLVTTTPTTQTIEVYGGAGNIGASFMFATSGAAGTFRIAPNHKCITLVASAPFGKDVPIFFTAEKLHPTVALQTVEVTFATPPTIIVEQASAYPSGATPANFFAGAPLTAAVPSVTVASFNIDVGQAYYLTGFSTFGFSRQPIPLALVAANPILETIMEGILGDVNLSFPAGLMIPWEGLSAGTMSFNYGAQNAAPPIIGGWNVGTVLVGYIL